MIPLARSLGAAVALAALVVLLGGAVPAAVAPPAEPVAPPAHVAPAVVTDTSAARRALADSADFESAAGDSFAPPQIFLAWHAPYGMPGATDTISFGAGDSNRVDTLYMSFETGRDIPKFLGMFARLHFRPAIGDTLGTYWRYGSGSPNYRNLAFEFDPDGTFPCPQPWIRSGTSVPEFEFDPGGARLDLFYVNLQLTSLIPVDGRVRYCFARMMFLQKRWGLPGARQPVCLEWSFSRYSVGREDALARSGPQRCISMNSPDGSVCAPYRSNQRPAPWAPKPRQAKP
jgi:hypothetical protein